MERSRLLIDLFVRIRVSARSRRSGAAAFICAASWAGGVDASNLGVTEGSGRKQATRQPVTNTEHFQPICFLNALDEVSDDSNL